VQDARRAQCSGACFFGSFLCTSKERNPLAEGEWKPFLLNAQKKKQKLDSSLRWNDERKARRQEGKNWIPAYAGMTSEEDAKRRITTARDARYKILRN
jgi:hypothetical protein